MTNQEVIKIKTMLEGNYPSLAKQEDVIYLSILQEYNFGIMAEAVKNVIKREKFPPNIAVILTEYDTVLKSKKRLIVVEMQKAGCFYHPSELDKALMFVDRDLIPDWFRKMMIDFVNKNQRLGVDKRLLLESGDL